MDFDGIRDELKRLDAEFDPAGTSLPREEVSSAPRVRAGARLSRSERVFEAVGNA
jgi:hypothetical protein